MTTVSKKDGKDTQIDFHQTYLQYHKKVLNTVLAIVQNLQDAEEITQDVFVKFHFNQYQYRGTASAGTWLYRIAVNSALDLLRKKKRRKRFAWVTGLFDSKEGKEVIAVPDFVHPGILLENREDAVVLFAFIDLLPERQKTALVLSVVEQLSYEETAKVMDTTVSSVESLVFRARKTIKQKLEKYFQK